MCQTLVSLQCLSVNTLHALLGSAGAESMDNGFLQFLANRILAYILFQGLTGKIGKMEEKWKPFSQWHGELWASVDVQVLTATPVAGTSSSLAAAAGRDLRDSWCYLFLRKGMVGLTGGNSLLCLFSFSAC